MEESENNILSIKIVSVDHYNSFPIPNLDSNYSEFRNCSVKYVPVIRIFGITQNKKKICANVHGVFPYFYIPCAEIDHEKITKLMNDLAEQIDKSINTSLGQSSSKNQHIYRISLVKGIPFYGYHQNEHQFLRLQLYNPNLVKRTSNLLQSGTIMSKQFQPHESHIPYILKFFIDYNLFGMSYLHVPLQFVHARNPDDNTRYRKRSVSEIEVDFKAIHILNRLAATEESSANKAANPGIESIWEDERQRREVLEAAPPMESEISQERNCPATKSDIFYQSILREKVIEGSQNSTMFEESFSNEIASSSVKDKKKTFNLKNFLDSSVYAAEFSQSSSTTSTTSTSQQQETDMEMFSQYVKDEEEIIPQLDGVDDEEQQLSPSELTKLRDHERNFHPQPGPSRLFIPPVRQTPSNDDANNQQIHSHLMELAKSFNKFPDNVEKVEDSPTSISDDDELVKSFYNQTMMIDEFEESEESSEALTEEVLNKTVKMECDDDEVAVMKPSFDPPSPSDVMKRLEEFKIPKHSNPTLFYSNPKDVTKRKEVGHNLLEIPGKRLCDLETFKSSLFVDYEKLKEIKNERRRNEIVICPYNDPPSYRDAVKWLKTGKTEKEEDESPVKDKREKTIMMLEDDEEAEATLIPSSQPMEEATTTPEIIQSSLEKDSSTLSEFIEDGLYLSYSARKKRMKKSFSRRFQEIMKAKVVEAEKVSSQSSSVSEVDKASETPESSSSNHSIIVKDANIQEDSSSFNNSNCDITGPTLNNTYGFKMKLESLQSNNEHTDLTILSMELHVQTRDEFKPNPEFDAVSAIFYSLDGYCGGSNKIVNGIIAFVDDKKNFRYIKQDVEVILVDSEMEVFEVFFQKIRDFDPDIIAGYEIETASWGYLVERGYVLNMNLNNALSRMPLDKGEKARSAQTLDDDEHHHDMGDYHSEQKIPGRIQLDVWRLMKHEIALTSYTFENISYHVLHRRYPKHSFSLLTSLWKQPLKCWIVLDYYIDRAKTLIEILQQLDLIGRTCELAKLFGIQFYEVLSRGSQFRVESMMIRIAKRRNYVPVSPSVQQRAHMRAPEYIPLILEPESRFYNDPVIVLDFQSLYPSIIIAYNYCFSTCLGRVEHLAKASSQPFEFGAYQLRVTPKKLKFLIENDLITISPCGVAFVKASVREGVLPRMLSEILSTRLMVKQSMKIHKNNSALQRVLHSRQLGLKLIANVTYGYTAANFSGRMPAIEVGDSVVSKGRETLERAINLVETNKKWGCRVCYGDTDSMFVLVPGRSREEAFKIGAEIADAVTNDNPHPVKLKLEKVYQPCILQTKKRYVGYMYESADQKDPIYEAKGIETVRRDGCPAAVKMLEKTLRILFETYDVSKVKEYVCRQFRKILAGRCSIQDLLFAKEFRGINGYKERASVPALTLTRKWKASDSRNEPRRGERVPFLIVNGAPGLPLIRLVRSPLEVLNDENYKINSIYYITKAIIPPLNRCLLLIGANAFEWFTELPRCQQFIPLLGQQSKFDTTTRKGTISQFFSTSSCVTCENPCQENVCSNCKSDSQKTVLAITMKSLNMERKLSSIKSICDSCCRRNFDTDCISLDCPVLYASYRAKRDYKQVQYLREVLDDEF
ncbi:CLUMA_CG004378, isoform A [Clunio marinus]|uniref:DNA polymerase n=1 Tax=Clunio marinus TaxID=568069 RepID=A0A1J1HRM6_9DIPT|nr:CLUMA_CG004378, isoform A [Clunio marinus]